MQPDNEPKFPMKGRMFHSDRTSHTNLFVQDNHSCSKKGVVRGMHYQLNPSPMGKLVKVVKGSIFDVGVDLREGSPSFGKWHGDTLSAENKKMLYFPPGIAHGFLSLENDTHVIYKCTGVYSSENERALMWNDPDVNIKWPTNLVSEIILSDRDKAHPSFKTAEKNFKF